jgi:hypothetical protein
MTKQCPDLASGEGPDLRAILGYRYKHSLASAKTLVNAWTALGKLSAIAVEAARAKGGRDIQV